MTLDNRTPRWQTCCCVTHGVERVTFIYFAGKSNINLFTLPGTGQKYQGYLQSQIIHINFQSVQFMNGLETKCCKLLYCKTILKNMVWFISVWWWESCPDWCFKSRATASLSISSKQEVKTLLKVTYFTTHSYVLVGLPQGIQNSLPCYSIALWYCHVQLLYLAARWNHVSFSLISRSTVVLWW